VKQRIETIIEFKKLRSNLNYS